MKPALPPSRCVRTPAARAGIAAAVLLAAAAGAQPPDDPTELPRRHRVNGRTTVLAARPAMEAADESTAAVWVGDRLLALATVVSDDGIQVPLSSVASWRIDKGYGEVNRKDLDDNNVFQGGFLGLDNISIFDRSQALTLHTGNGVILLVTSDLEAAAGLRLMGVTKTDGNWFYMKVQLENLFPKIVSGLA